MAHAYETIERGGRLTSGTLGASDFGPVGISQVKRGSKVLDTNHVRTRRVIPQSVADQMNSIMNTVVTQGTGTHARIGEWAAGKTGTTENYGDAWFIGFTHEYTTAVWVGYPDRLTSMKTLYNGQPVMGGTYPADIWHDVMTSIETIQTARENARRLRLIAKLQAEGKDIPPSLAPTTPSTGTPVAPSTGTTTPQSTTTPQTTTPSEGGTDGGQTPPATPDQNAPPTPATPPPDNGTGGAGAGGAAAPSG
jgi:penicillin-binding protein 1A